MQKFDASLIAALEKNACPVGEAFGEYGPIIEAASDKQIILIGEASHGSAEFYRTRAEITQRLIEEKGYDAVVVEADWPDAYAINRYVRGLDPNMTAEATLEQFERFPTWMWANYEVLHFIKWLRAFNDMYQKETRAVGFYGLDLYSMGASINAVITYLEKVDPKASEQARQRYGCLEHFMDNPQSYGYAMKQGLADSCEKEIIEQLIDLRKKSYEYMKLNGFVASDEYFCAEQNAKLVCNAEEYYRAMFSTHDAPRPNLWNMRDRHMFETLESLKVHLGKQLDREAKIVVWAHNSHIGNAAATQMSHRGELNIGQLTKEAYGERALLIGFSTAKGTVTAASNWEMPTERKNIRPPIPGSYEDIFHKVNQKKFFLNLQENNEATDQLRAPRLQRAIGVIYRPETERESHYSYSVLPEQFDFMIHFDDTNAIKPLEITPHWHRGELDETYPSGL
tara:strand:- start:1872 stop:3230 length:1359 start_codon:yes stop_codon:yes gene_type:complete